MKIASILFAAFMLLVGIGYEWMALKMPRGTFAYPGPGLFPLIVGAFMIAMALGCLVQELLSRRSAPSAASGAAAGPATPLAAPAAVTAGERNVKKTYQLTALTAAYILLLKPIGYPICIALFLAAAIRIFGYRRWLPTAAMAAVIAAFSYVAFVVWLKVPLPMGLLEDLLG